MDAWRKVDTYFPSSRPQNIFIVTGQLLTNEFCISHKEYGSDPCEVKIKTQTKLPDSVDPDVILSYGLKDVVGSIGFEQVFRKEINDSNEYSIVLEVFNSPRIQQFRPKGALRERVEHYYRYALPHR
jgi:hypothetical protein